MKEFYTAINENRLTVQNVSPSQITLNFITKDAQGNAVPEDITISSSQIINLSLAIGNVHALLACKDLQNALVGGNMLRLI